MEYNYVFFWSGEQYYRNAFLDILEREDVRYISDILYDNNKFIRTVHLIHHSSAINRIINLPFRYSWRKRYFKNDFSDQRPIIFVFHGSYYWMKSVDYFSYLKEVFPNSKCVLLLMDTVESYKKYFKGRFCGDFDVLYVKKTFDHIVTYNILDSKKYQFDYYPSIYSRPTNLSLTDRKLPSKDVFFVGRAKDRLELIHNAYQLLVKNGLICDFYVAGVPKQQQLYDGIHYNVPLTYDQVLDHVRNSKGILELVQGGADGFTFRLDEALVFNRNLITNNPVIKTLTYKDSKKIYYYSNDMELNKEDYEHSFMESYGYQDEYSPLRFLEYLEKVFNSKVRDDNDK